jgi:hypothetical protein
MDTAAMMRDVKLALELSPVFWQNVPEIQIKFNEIVLFNGKLEQDKKFEWLLEANDLNRLSLYLTNKTDADCQDGKDMAVTVNKIGIENFYYENFMHATNYRPDYTDGYYTYAKENNIIVEPVIHSNYLGFNGEWWLEFTWPTFTWIYNLETTGLGWIYEKNV